MLDLVSGWIGDRPALVPASEASLVYFSVYDSAGGNLMAMTVVSGDRNGWGEGTFTGILCEGKISE